VERWAPVDHYSGMATGGDEDGAARWQMMTGRTLWPFG
jgi:hypothetical protein